ncbi:MAG: hypothetical protein QM703_04290 [Gemmatales bacterium]
MTWFTYLTGLIIFAIGAIAKFVLHLGEWQALLPLVIGLGYVTFAEGMRSTKKQKRTFLFLAILWSIVTLVCMIPVAKEGYALWSNDPARMNGPVLRSEIIMEHAGVMIVSAIYLVFAVISLFKPSTPVATSTVDNSTRTGR